MDSFGFIYSADGKRLLKGASVKGAYWIPEGVEEIEPGALIGCKIGTLHVPWTAHVHEQCQLVFSEDEEENEELYQIWYDQNELNSWSTNWDGHESLYQTINGAAVYALDKYLENEKPVFWNPIDVLWELSQETIDAF